MNYKDRKHHNELLAFKDNVLKELDNFITTRINSSSDADYKKAALISYWLSDFHKYMNWESDFVPQKLKRYERGDIVKVNLGFNIGSEEGGLHYAVVIDNNNALNSGVITVIPLSSKKQGREVHKVNVDLGNDIYAKLKIKCDDKKTEILKRVSEAKSMLNILDHVDLDSVSDQSFRKISSEIKQRLSEAQTELRLVEKIEKEIGQMKAGSIGLVSQITTVSKMRIYDPRHDGGVLSGIKLSPAGLDLINEKITELFLRSDK